MSTAEYEIGRKAFAAGKSLDDNPHKAGIEAHEEWARGWSAAKWAKRIHDNADWAEESRSRAARIYKALGNQ